MPSGPGWFWARVSAMNRWPTGTSSPLPAIPSGPRVTSGSSSLRGTNTVAPLLTVWSTPWSKNWPKKVNSELYGGERPPSVVTLGMKRVWWDGTHPSGTAATAGVPRVPGGPSGAFGVAGTAATGSVVHGVTSPREFWERTGNFAAAIAAGLVEVWSTIRLLTVRGWESTTSPRVE